MGSWYWIGVSAGLGTAFGIFFSAFFGVGRTWGIGATVLGVATGVGIGWVIADWQPGDWADRIAGVGGAVLGLLGAVPIVVGALRRGGTRGGTATLVTGAALVAAGIAFVPVAGYLEALALPAVAARLRRTRPERYAGLRTLARD